MEEEFKIGDVVLLRSGGLQMTITKVDREKLINAVYWSPVIGEYCKIEGLSSLCVRMANARPEVPKGTDKMRSTSVAQSTL